MKLLQSTIVLLFTFTFSTYTNAQMNISSIDAPFHTGKSVVACGLIKEIVPFKSGVYLNMDKHHPHQSLTLVVWDDDLNEFENRHGELNKLINSRACASGRVKMYRGRSQISLQNAYSFKSLVQ